MEVETCKPMKMKLAILKLLVVLGSALATTAVLGQTTYTWTGAANGTNIATAGNWTTNGSTPAVTVPNGTYQDTAQWDGVTASNLVISYGSSGLPGTGFGSLGINLVLTANQTNPVQIISSVALSPVVGVNNVNIASGAGAFRLGDGTANVLNIIGRPSGGFHDWINNSTNPAIICPNVRWQAGGGAAYTLAFDGTGNWFVTNNLTPAGGSTVNLAKLGSGTWAWSGPSIPAAIGNPVINSPVVINEGTVILARSGLLANQAIQNYGATPTLLQYDAAAQAQTLGGAISGPMTVMASAGTLTLSGQSTFTGNIVLTNTGTLIVSNTENAGVSGPLGVGGTISFTGGTLGFSVNNTFDYSSRFDTSANQAYSFNTGGQSVTFATGLGSSDGTLTKIGAGTLTLSGASSYSGLTTVSGGKLVFQGSKTGSGDITVADSAALGVTATGTPVAPGTLTLGTSSGATLEFNNVNSTTTAPLAAGTLTSAGTVTININGGSFTAGQSYPLLTWTSGSAPAVSLGSVSGAAGSLSTNGNTIRFNVMAPLIWTGNNNGSWDTNTSGNWVQGGNPVVFTNGSPALFDDTAPGATTVTVNALVQPSTLTISNRALAYSIGSSGGNNIAGSTGLTKRGTGTLTLSGGANTYTGVTTISGGTVSVGALANSGAASDIGAASSSAVSLVLEGGTLRYTGGGVSIDRSFTLGPSGGAIDASGTGALHLPNSGPVAVDGSGPRVLTLTGTNPGNNTLAAALANSSSGSATLLMKNGPGKWVLTGTNTHSGSTTVSNGVLQIGDGGATGSPGNGNIVNNGALVFNRSGTLTIPGAVSGTGSVTNDGSGTVSLAGTYSGATTINAGTLHVGGVLNGNIFDNTTLVVDGGATLGGVISGPGQVIVQGSLTLLGDNTYSGGTTINYGSSLSIGNGGATGKLNPNVGVVNNYTLIFNSSSDSTLNGIISGTGSVVKNGSGALTLTATNTYSGDTVVYGGSLFVNGGNALSIIFIQGGTLGGTGSLSAVVVNAGGTLAPGASAGSVGTLTINSLWFGSNLAIDVNKSLSPSNDLVVVSGMLGDSGAAPGTLTVSNPGPALAVGDKFTVFSQPLANGAALTVTGAGATWANHLAVDGSITVTAVTRPALNFTNPGNSLQFSWDTSFGSFRLQAQTNSLSVGLGNNWGDYPGGGTSPVTVPMDVTKGTVFFRLVSP
jgi:fibronectin-binding autotransporter adhesin